MRMIGRVLLGLVLVMVVAQTAQASVYVWWTDNSVAGETQAMLQKGHGLVIEQPQNSTTTYHLAMWMWSDEAGPSALTCYSARLYHSQPGAGNLDPNVVASNFAYLYPWTTYVPAAPILNAPNTTVTNNYLVTNFSALKGIPEAVFPTGTTELGARKMLSLDVTVTVGPASDWHYIYTGVGSSKFARLDGTFASQVFFGDRPAVNGGTVTSTPAYTGLSGPVISVHAIPEPGTLMLLGIGLIGLLRRR